MRTLLTFLLCVTCLAADAALLPGGLFSSARPVPSGGGADMSITNRYWAVYRYMALTNIGGIDHIRDSKSTNNLPVYQGDVPLDSSTWLTNLTASDTNCFISSVGAYAYTDPTDRGQAQDILFSSSFAVVTWVRIEAQLGGIVFGNYSGTGGFEVFHDAGVNPAHWVFHGVTNASGNMMRFTNSVTIPVNTWVPVAMTYNHTNGVIATRVYNVWASGTSPSGQLYSDSTCGLSLWARQADGSSIFSGRGDMTTVFSGHMSQNDVDVFINFINDPSLYLP